MKDFMIKICLSSVCLVFTQNVMAVPNNNLKLNELNSIKLVFNQTNTVQVQAISRYIQQQLERQRTMRRLNREMIRNLQRDPAAMQEWVEMNSVD